MSQFVDGGYPVAERHGMSSRSIYIWKAQFSNPEKVPNKEARLSAELRRVNKERARVAEERDILK